MDRLLSIYSNSWFNGTSEIYNIKQIVNEKADKLLATNLVTNGDFSNGTSGFDVANTTLSATNNTLTGTGTGGGSNIFISQTHAFTNGRKYYAKVRVRTLSATSTTMSFGTNLTIFFSLVPVQNQWYNWSIVFSATSDTSIRFINSFANPTAQNGQRIEVQYVSVIDLTTIFGAGKEPTALEMDRLLSIYSNSWFNGTSEIYNIKQIVNEKADKLFATNLVTNGDFSNGTTGWLSSNVALSSLGNELVATGNGGSAFSSVYQDTGVLAAVGKKVHFRSKAKITDGIASTLTQQLTGSTGGGIPLGTINNPVLNTEYTFSNVFTLDSSILGTIRLFPYVANFGSTVAQNGSVVKVEYVSAVDLTAIFGAGKEPTVEQMDRLLSIYSNSWFNGTSEIYNIKQIVNEKADKLLATNLVTNGDFSNGTSGWTTSNGTHSANSNTLTSTANGSASSASVFNDSAPIPIQTEKYYARTRTRVTNVLSTMLRFRFSDGITSFDIRDINNPTENQWYELSGIWTIPSSNPTRLRVQLLHYYVDSATANGKSMQVQYTLVINLTQLFGAGKEPSATEMDRLLANFPNSWFNGTQELMGVKDLTKLVSEKVDKARFGLNTRPNVFAIRCNAGRMAFSWNNSAGRYWVFPKGTVTNVGNTPILTSTAEKPDVIIPRNNSIVYLFTTSWQGSFTLNDNETDVRYIGLLADLPPLTYWLSLSNCSLVTGNLSDLPPLTHRLDLGNCSLVTGNLSDLPPLTHFLSLSNCSLVTGNLSDLPPLTHWLDLGNCSLVTGNLSDLPPLTYLLSLSNCSLVTGNLSDLPPLTHFLSLSNCSLITGAHTNVSGSSVPTFTYLDNTGMSATDMDNTLIAYALTIKNNGTFRANGKTRTSASDSAVATLVGRGWGITGITVV